MDTRQWPIDCSSCGHQEGRVVHQPFKNQRGFHRRLECAACGRYIRFLRGQEARTPTEDQRLETTDARVWAQEWCRIARQIATSKQSWAALDDEGWMIGWFANAIERGRTAGYQQAMAEMNERVGDG
jgi:hypothetical protein